MPPFPAKEKHDLFGFQYVMFLMGIERYPPYAHKCPLITPAFFGAGVALGNRCFARCLRYQRNLSSICQVASLDVIPKYVGWIVSVCIAWRHVCFASSSFWVEMFLSHCGNDVFTVSKDLSTTMNSTWYHHGLHKFMGKFLKVPQWFSTPQPIAGAETEPVWQCWIFQNAFTGSNVCASGHRFGTS